MIDINNIDKELYTSFEGRINREVYWKKVVLPVFIINVLLIIIGQVLASAIGSLAMIITLPVSIALIWVSAAANAKRLHDRNISGWWQLLVLIPIFGLIYWIYWIGILEGTKGPNDFGPDPLEGKAATTVNDL